MTDEAIEAAINSLNKSREAFKEAFLEIARLARKQITLPDEHNLRRIINICNSVQKEGADEQG